jgi:hypothetical protein
LAISLGIMEITRREGTLGATGMWALTAIVTGIFFVIFGLAINRAAVCATSASQRRKMSVIGFCANNRDPEVISPRTHAGSLTNSV